MNVNERVVEWFLRNARIKHGHPVGDDTVTIERTTGMGPVASVALAALAGAGGLAALQHTGWLGAESDNAGAVVLENAPEYQPPAPSDASLYQYLEDRGYHLP